MSKIRKIATVIEKLYLIAFRNRMILMMVNCPAKKNRVNLNWAPLCKYYLGGFACTKKKTNVQNFGDYLAVPIYEYMLKYYNLDGDKKIKSTKHLYTIGSIILMGYQDATIWGSGILESEPEGLIWSRNKYRKLDVRCVRGPKTKKRLIENGIDVSRCRMGDPGVLLPLIYKPEEYEEKREYSVILHESFRDSTVENVIDIYTSDWKDTINQIYNSKRVISSSLHGIIIAEAYGVPAILLDQIVHGDRFKYNDYYLSTGRSEYPVCKTVEEGIKMPLPKVPDLSELQKNLIESFPTDLWE